MGRLSIALAVVYPLLVYLSLGRVRARWLALGLAALAAGRLLVSSRGALPGLVREARPGLFALLLLACASAFSDSRLLLLAMPGLVSFALLWIFARSLAATPIVERFARAQVDALTPEELRYCRTVTLVWCAFFLANGATALLLAFGAPLSLWALYTGLISYLLVGFLFATEWLVRKWRFRRYQDGPLDSVVRRVFPPRIS